MKCLTLLILLFSGAGIIPAFVVALFIRNQPTSIIAQPKIKDKESL